MDKKIFQNTILEKQYQPAKWQEVLKDYFSVKKLHQQPQPIILPANDIAENAIELGSFYTADDRLVGIYEITIKTDATTKIDINRVGLRSLLRNIYKYDVDAALIVFIHGRKWRFSYVSEIRTEEGKKETEPKRYTYLFGEGESCRTAADRFDKLKGKQIYLNDLFDAFSVEKLNKDFFKTYKEFHERFWKFLTDDDKYYKLLYDKRQEDKVKREKPIRDFAKKLLGRIVFLQFLQKKGWMGVPFCDELKVKSEKWMGGDPKYLQNLFLHCPYKAQFHSKYLKTLFFSTLNIKRENDIAPPELSCQSFNHKNHSSDSYLIPYLNGGLFDKDISFENSIDFPEEFFSQLLDFFEQYNFTIDENDPYDSEVGIDPEMLGHIFENLLEENREKGAFYTPKEIVHYMCQESLIQYLRTHLPECTEDDSPATKALENFIRNGIIGDRHDKKNFVVQQAKRIEKLLDNVKICDPAIGSGAFPMGMLQEIFKAKTSLDLTLDHAEVKRQIIQNNIYGVDIEPGAVDIARLRFWLALVVDETEPQPLPNLDYKIMQGNSLLEQFEDISLKFEKKVFEVKVVKEVDLFGRPINPQYSINEYLQTKQSAKEFDITELEEKYFNSNNADEKQQIREKIENFERQFILEQLDEREKQIKEILKHKEIDFKKDLNAVGEAKAEYLSKGKKAKDIEKQKAELEKVRQYRKRLNEIKPGEKPWFLWHLYFMDVFDTGGFDIVIGNPPYISIKDISPNEKEFYLNQFNTASGQFDIYGLFLERGVEILKKNGIISMITSNTYLNNKDFYLLRKLLLTNTKILEIVNLDETIFETAQVDVAIIIIKKDSPSIANEILLYPNKDSFLKRISSTIKQKVYYNEGTLFEFKLNCSNLDFNLIEKISKNNLLLKDILKLPRGIEIGGNSELIKDRYFEGGLKLLVGKDIKRYEINFKNKYIEFNHNDKSVFKDYFIYTQEKILIQRIRNLSLNQRIVAALDTDKYLCTNTLRIGYLINNDFTLKFLLAIINSKLINFLFLKFFINKDIYAYQLEQIPIVESSAINQSIYESLVSEIIRIKKDRLDSSKYENKIDALVFNLYNLTESEMLQVLDTFKDLSIKDRNQIQNEYWNIANNKFQLEI